MDEQKRQISGEIWRLREEAVGLANAHRHAEAQKILVQAEEMCRRVGDEAALIAILHERAITASTGGDPAEALKVVTEAREIAEGIGDWEQLLHIARSQNAVYNNLKDATNASQPDGDSP